MILEDLHAIDPDTQALIDGLVDSLPTARILFVVSYRPEYRHGWTGKKYYNQIRMNPLSSGGASELLGALAGTDSGLEPAEAPPRRKNGRKPVLLEESVRALVDSGVLAGEPGAIPLPGRCRTSRCRRRSNPCLLHASTG